MKVLMYVEDIYILFHSINTYKSCLTLTSQSACFRLLAINSSCPCFSATLPTGKGTFHV